MVGRCKTFDESADGYGRGEGFAVACLAPAGFGALPLAIIQARFCSSDARSFCFHSVLLALEVDL